MCLLFQALLSHAYQPEPYILCNPIYCVCMGYKASLATTPKRLFQGIPFVRRDLREGTMFSVDQEGGKGEWEQIMGQGLPLGMGNQD
jgi:hypothetical protein